MALSHKDWELPNSRIWLAEMDIDRGLDFPISTGISTGNVLKWKSCKLRCKIIDCFHLTIFISASAKKLMRKNKKSKEDEKTLELSQAKCQLVQTSCIKPIKLLLLLPYNKLLINRGKSVCVGESRLRLYACTDLTTFGLYLRPRSRFSHTDLLLG